MFRFSRRCRRAHDSGPKFELQSWIFASHTVGFGRCFHVYALATHKIDTGDRTTFTLNDINA
jgi:hypothetical protein